MSKTSIELTQNWLENWVIEYNLCPFARYPFEQGLVRIVSSNVESEDEIFKFVLDELQTLYQTEAKTIETSLLVLEKGLRDFQTYLDFLLVLENVIPETGLEGVIQIASFHPDYCFEGEAVDDPANKTNQSPFPMFHLIREASLERALKDYPEPEKIPQRNIQLLRDMFKKNNLE